MARTGDPDSATAQFFINTVDNRFLDFKDRSTRGWGYCVFGKVVAGMDVVSAIEGVSTAMLMGRRDVPAKVVLIKQVTVEALKAEPEKGPTGSSD